MRQFRDALFCVALFGLVLVLAIGCGGGGTGTDTVISLTSYTLTGQITLPQSASSLRAAASGAAAGAKVCLEDEISINTLTDSNGNFSISGVPKGTHRLIVSIDGIGNTTSYRYRSSPFVLADQSFYTPVNMKDLIDLSYTGETIRLEECSCYAILALKDKEGKLLTNLNGARASVWNNFVFSAGSDGKIKVGPFTKGKVTDVVVSADAFESSTLPLVFLDCQTEQEIVLFNVNEIPANKPPVVSIFTLLSGNTAKACQTIELVASYTDFEQDKVSYKWSASAGSFFNDTAENTTYSVPASVSSVTITLTGNDGNIENSTATVKLNLNISGSVNSAPDKPSSPNPAASAEGLNANPVIAWTCTDPDGDILTYDVYLGTSENSLSLTAADISTASMTLSDLAYETEYFWKIVAKDAFHQTSSDVWCFKTVSVSELPGVASVIPADNAVDVASNASVIIEFNRSVSEKSDFAGFVFTPQATGTWTWAAENKASFAPEGTWVPGLKYTFCISAASIVDDSGFEMSENFQSTFVTESVIPVPSGYIAAGFPITVAPGETFNVSVSSLEEGKSVYAMLVNPDENTANRHSDAYVFRGLDAKMRTCEQELLASKKKIRATSVDARAARKTVAVGDARSFYVYTKNSGNKVEELITTTCMNVGDHCLVYADNNLSTYFSSELSAAFMPYLASYSEAVCKKFDDTIYDTAGTTFGEPIDEIDGEERLVIVLTKLSGAYGYFYARDFYSDLANTNNGKIIYIDYCTISSYGSEIPAGYLYNLETAYITIIHEYQHLINFSVKYLNGHIANDTWLNEGLSVYSEELLENVGFPDTIFYIRGAQGDITFDPQSLSLTDFDGFSSYVLHICLLNL